MAEPEIAPFERFSIVQECTQLIARFAQRNDARDADALAEMFVKDGVFIRPTKPDQPYKGRESIRDAFRAKPANIVTRHVVANVVVDVVSASEAKAQSYLLLYTAPATEGGLPKADAKQLLGAFDDRIVRDGDGMWKFRERRGSLAMTIGG
jgi:uncharacterized protein (TIGR02246 family)